VTLNLNQKNDPDETLNQKNGPDEAKRGGGRPLDYTTGDDARRPAKFGQPRREDDGYRQDEAARLNNAPPVYELLDGRCSYDGLPAGNCAHFPGYGDAEPPLKDEHAPEKEKTAAGESGRQEPRKS
jgi:hypothetical protein